MTTVTFTSAPGPLDNPLKGWAPYTGGKLYQPYSMVYRYAGWRELEPHEGEYAFADWEAKTWDVPQARSQSGGRHVIFRVYLDYPTLPSGLPDWLRAHGVTETAYPDMGGGVSPNYEHPALVAGLERLIAALGARYDRNPRIAFIEAGLLGHWGEWHTYPNAALFASNATQRRVVDAYRAAFPHKKIQFRYAGGYVGQQSWVGFHDDYFPEDTGTEKDWQFLARIQSAGRGENWRRAPIGGEMIPERGKNALKWLGSDDDFAFTLRQAAATHFTWIGPYGPAMEAPPTPAFDARCQEMVRRMGYQFRLDTLRHEATLRRSQPLALELRGVNEGIAPFYYPWEVRLALLDADSGRVVAQTPLTPTVDIRDWQPGVPFRVRASVGLPPIRAGRYALALGIIDPLTGRPAIGFANRLPPRPAGGWTRVSAVQIAEA